MSTPPSGHEPITDADFVMSSIGDILDQGNVRDPDGITARAMVPGTHEAYARILHPPWEDRSRERRTRWSDIAARSGAKLEGTVAFRRITVPPDSDIPLGPQGAWDQDATPMDGTLPRAESDLLIHLLEPAPSCWFIVWLGWDGLQFDPGQVTVRLRGNPYLVFRGPVEAVRGFDWTGSWQVPHMWFPDDRAWCVGGDIDAYDTYVGGSAHLVERIVAAPDLETLRVQPEDHAILRGEWGIVR